MTIKPSRDAIGLHQIFNKALCGVLKDISTRCAKKETMKKSFGGAGTFCQLPLLDRAARVASTRQRL